MQGSSNTAVSSAAADTGLTMSCPVTLSTGSSVAAAVWCSKDIKSWGLSLESGSQPAPAAADITFHLHGLSRLPNRRLSWENKPCLLLAPAGPRIRAVPFQDSKLRAGEGDPMPKAIPGDRGIRIGSPRRRELLSTPSGSWSPIHPSRAGSMLGEA